MAADTSDASTAAASKGPATVASCVTFLALTWLTVALRFWVRKTMLKTLGLDDWMAGIALIFFTLYCTFLLKIVTLGGGSHVTFDTPEGLRNLGELLKCGNPTKILENKLTGHCIASNVQLGFSNMHVAVSAATDWTLAILPVIILWNANMDRRTKASVGGILMLGAIGSTATLVRFKFESGLFNDADFFFSAANVTITCIVEVGTGITAGSLATLRPLFRCCLSRIRSSFSSRDRSFRYAIEPYTKRRGSGYPDLLSAKSANSYSTYSYDNATTKSDVKLGTIIKDVEFGGDRSPSLRSEEEIGLAVLFPQSRHATNNSAPAPQRRDSDKHEQSFYRIERAAHVRGTYPTADPVYGSEISRELV
ncbi:MAG: hypothetical protein M1820_005310 [Bogoriella megaspora]|nr:MAG: hypothetical protein M1820_005310 [Bogoriella megaspora]